MIFIIVAHPDGCWRTTVIFNVSVTATNLKVSNDGNVLIKIYLIWLFVHQLTSYHSYRSYHFNMICYTQSFINHCNALHSYTIHINTRRFVQEYQIRYFQ